MPATTTVPSTIVAPVAPAAAPAPPVSPAALAGWLEAHAATQDPLPSGRVRVVGLVVIDHRLADAHAAVRCSWIGDGPTGAAVLAAQAAELDRFDAVAVIAWAGAAPEVSVVLVNP